MSLLSVGAPVWVTDPKQVWVPATIQSIGKDKVVVERENTRDKIVLKSQDPTFLRGDDNLDHCDDLTTLNHLHEPAILQALELRFRRDQIYTLTGPILIAVNPFKTIPDIYDLEAMRTASPQKPHVFSIAQAAFRGVCEKGTSQTVLISGESGAGKTETTKHVMNFLARAGASESPVERQVLQTNPLLEAFGNACTLRNDNSSRFGKFIELQFQPSRNSHRLCGATIHTYLLESVRVTKQQEGERNYHIFYQMCAAAKAYGGGEEQYEFPQVVQSESQVLDMTGLGGGYSNYRFLAFSKRTVLEGVDNVKEFEKTIHAMKTVGLSCDEIQSIIAVTAAVLNIGNIRFTDKDGSSVVSEKTRTSLHMAAHLLGIRAPDLERSLCQKTMKTREGGRENSLLLQMETSEAEAGREAFARNLYSFLFLKIVARANESIGFLPGQLFCGILDIFGFESFETNSFEQLCINFANERLQQFFNNFVFKLEEQVYAEDGIEWTAFDFPDNDENVQLFEARTGIFSMLDDECSIPNGNESSYVNKLKKAHESHRSFDVVKTKQHTFTVHHFAGPVTYNAANFIVKNKDKLRVDAVAVMKNSTNAWIAGLFANEKCQEEKERRTIKMATVSSEFKDQLESLMEKVKKTDPHFIRCLKPNQANRRDVFDRISVCEQLRYGGVLQVVRVSRAGFPVRLIHDDAWKEFNMLLPERSHARLNICSSSGIRLTRCLEIIHGADKSWAVGKTMVFFKQELYEGLTVERQSRIECATRIQSVFRTYRLRKRWQCHVEDMRLVVAFVRKKQAVLAFDRGLITPERYSNLSIEFESEVVQEETGVEETEAEESEMEDADRIDDGLPMRVTYIDTGKTDLDPTCSSSPTGMQKIWQGVRGIWLRPTSILPTLPVANSAIEQTSTGSQIPQRVTYIGADLTEKSNPAPVEKQAPPNRDDVPQALAPVALTIPRIPRGENDDINGDDLGVGLPEQQIPFRPREILPLREHAPLLGNMSGMASSFSSSKGWTRPRVTYIGETTDPFGTPSEASDASPSDIREVQTSQCKFQADIFTPKARGADSPRGWLHKRRLTNIGEEHKRDESEEESEYAEYAEREERRGLEPEENPQTADKMRGLLFNPDANSPRKLFAKEVHSSETTESTNESPASSCSSQDCGVTDYETLPVFFF